ncbi:MAG: hypothetical protein JRN08_09340 [Nitrososphaerota archaeon]|nr:hypothetical protein [Nitrososphaerota archaeon]
MKGKGPAAAYLRPILDTYMGAAVALVGCASRGIERYSCELDVLVVASEAHPPASLKVRDAYADLAFVTEKEVLKPANPERALAIATAKPVRDTSLVLSTGTAAALATFSDSAKAACRTRLTSALKTTVRAEESVSRGAVVDADFWLLAASYEFAYALLLSREVVPSPSHLLSQLRTTSMGAPKGFEGVSIGAGLEAATRAGCGTRLDGLTVLHDLIREDSASATAESEWSETRGEIIGAKARELVTRAELAECYSFLGQELVDGLLAVQRLHPKRTVGSLASGEDKLLGERLVRQLGLTRDEKAIRAALEVLRRQVTLLTKKI